jgi:integrase
MPALPLEDIALTFPAPAFDFAEPANRSGELASVSSPPRLHPAAPADPDLRPVAAFLTGGIADTAAIPWRELRRQDVLAVRAWVREALSAPVAQRAIEAFRRAILGGGPASAEVLSPALFRLHSARIPRGRRLTPREVWRILDACQEDCTPYGKRDTAIIALMVFAGLLPSQVARLRMSDYDDQLKTLRVPKSASTAVTRIISIESSVAAAMDAWLALCPAGYGTLFRRLNVGAEATGGAALTPTAMNRILLKRGRQALTSGFRPIDLRATYLGAIRDQARQGPFGLSARFGLGEDGEALIISASLTIAPPAGSQPKSGDDAFREEP